MPCVIQVEHLSKAYRLGQIGSGTLTNDLRLWWARLRGQPNPLLKIGQADLGNRQGETIWALREISFQVAQGEVLGIIGRNGAGKSTLLKILSRVTAPTSGEVRVKGRIASLLEVGTGFHPELTGRENIYLNGAILGMSRQEVRRKLDEIVAFAEVEPFLDTPVKRYSSGMYVRLAFAVAAHLEPEILLVDEVLAVGDAEFQKKCLGKMGDIAGEGRTVLFVSHNLDAIRNLCQKCILLTQGRMNRYGESSEIIRDYLGFHQQMPRRKLDLTSSTININELRLLNENQEPAMSFRWDQPFQIEVSYQVLRTVPGLAIGIVVSAEDGRPVFTTSSRSAEGNQELGLGHGISQVSIPSHFLSPGEYSLYINAHTIFETFCFMDNAMTFKIEDAGREILGREGTMKWPGVVSPLLRWQNIRAQEQRLQNAR